MGDTLTMSSNNINDLYFIEAAATGEPTKHEQKIISSDGYSIS